MELRHLRYFVAVAEEGSLTVAAERRLHTAQPSLSRHRALEYEVGAQLLTRSAHGVVLTSAGKAFLEHAPLTLTQAEAAMQAAPSRRPTVQANVRLGLPDRAGDGLAARDNERPQGSAIHHRRYRFERLLDPARQRAHAGKARSSLYMRPETGMPGLDYRVIVREPIVVVLAQRSIASAARGSIRPQGHRGRDCFSACRTRRRRCRP